MSASMQHTLVSGGNADNTQIWYDILKPIFEEAGIFVDLPNKITQTTDISYPCICGKECTLRANSIKKRRVVLCNDCYFYRSDNTFIEPTHENYAEAIECTKRGEEIWRQVRNYPNYDISNMGRFRHFRKAVSSKKRVCANSGYVKVGVFGTDTKYDTKGLPIGTAVCIHKLVATTFIPKSEYTDSMTIDHINQKRDDNTLTNLQFATKKEQRANQSYPETNSTNIPIWQCDIDGNKLKWFASIKDAVEWLVNSPAHISATNTEIPEIFDSNGKTIRSRVPSAFYLFCMEKSSGRPIPLVERGGIKTGSDGRFIKPTTLTRSGLKIQYRALDKNEKKRFEDMAIQAKNADISLPLDMEGQIKYDSVCARVGKACLGGKPIQFGYTWMLDEDQNKEILGERWATVPPKVLGDSKNEYEASTLGRVRRKDNKKILSGSIANGYRVYTFRQKDKDGQKEPAKTVKGHREPAKTVKGHRIVALTFIPNPDNKRCVDHINANKQDNRVENLRWATDLENKRAHETISNRAWTPDQDEALLKSLEDTPKFPQGNIKWNLYKKPGILEHRTIESIQGRLRHFVQIRKRDENIRRYENRNETNSLKLCLD